MEQLALVVDELGTFYSTLIAREGANYMKTINKALLDELMSIAKCKAVIA